MLPICIDEILCDSAIYSSSGHYIFAVILVETEYKYSSEFRST